MDTPRPCTEQPHPDVIASKQSHPPPVSRSVNAVMNQHSEPPAANKRVATKPSPGKNHPSEPSPSKRKREGDINSFSISPPTSTSSITPDQQPPATSMGATRSSIDQSNPDNIRTTNQNMSPVSMNVDAARNPPLIANQKSSGTEKPDAFYTPGTPSIHHSPDGSSQKRYVKGDLVMWKEMRNNKAVWRGPYEVVYEDKGRYKLKNKKGGEIKKTASHHDLMSETELMHAYILFWRSYNAMPKPLDHSATTHQIVERAPGGIDTGYLTTPDASRGSLDIFDSSGGEGSRNSRQEPILPFKDGDFVMKKTPKGSADRQGFSWIGPYLVVSRRENGKYRLVKRTGKPLKNPVSEKELMRKSSYDAMSEDLKKLVNVSAIDQITRESVPTLGLGGVTAGLSPSALTTESTKEVASGRHTKKLEKTLKHKQKLTGRICKRPLHYAARGKAKTSTSPVPRRLSAGREPLPSTSAAESAKEVVSSSLDSTKEKKDPAFKTGSLALLRNIKKGEQGVSIEYTGPYEIVSCVIDGETEKYVIRNQVLAGEPKKFVSRKRLRKYTPAAHRTSEETRGAATARPSTSSTLEVTSSSDALPTCRTRDCRYCPKLNKTGFIMKHNGDAGEGFATMRRTRTVCCKDKNLIYCITCQSDSCGMQYVGKTERTIAKRFQGHFRNIETMNMKDGPIGEHFNSAGHDGVDDVEISILEFIRKGAKQSLGGRENFWMSKLNTFAPNGLNHQNKQAD